MIEEYGNNILRKEIIINNRIMPREYLAEISKYQISVADLIEKKTDKNLLEDKLIKK